MSGVSSVLTVESISTKSPLYEKGLRPGDRTRSINEEVASGVSWFMNITHGVSIREGSNVALNNTVSLTWTPADAGPEMIVSADVQVAPYVSKHDSWGSSGRVEGTVGVEVDEIVALTRSRPALTIPENVTGASAGVVHAMAYLDAITPGDLTGGMTIAATAAIQPNGRLDPVAGAAVKAEAAELANANVLFMHPSNAATIVDVDVLVIPVRHFSEVVRWLCQNGGTSTACYWVWTSGPALGIPDGFVELQASLDERAAAPREVLRPNSGPL